MEMWYQSKNCGSLVMLPTPDSPSPDPVSVQEYEYGACGIEAE